MVKIHEFETTGELEDVSNTLARAEAVDLQAKLGDETRDLDQYGIYNARDDQIEYIASDRYNIVQHREVIDAIRAAVGSTVGTIDKGVIRDHGSKIDGVLVFGNQDEARVEVQEIIDDYEPPEWDYTNDTLGCGMRFQNSFDGGRKFGGSTMCYRYICGNWMVWGENELASETSKHTQMLTPDYFEDIVDHVFELRDETEGVIVDAEDEELPTEWVPGVLQEQAGFGKNRAKRIGREVIKQRQPRDGETTMWRLHNAATNVVEHRDVQKVGQGRHETVQARAGTLLTEEPEQPEAVVELSDWL